MSFEVKDCIKKLHHSGFIVKDLDRSLRFYQDTLKMDLKMRWIETAEQCDVGMCVPGCKLELAQLVGYGAEVELIQFLLGWLSNHILGMDKQIGIYMDEAQKK